MKPLCGIAKWREKARAYVPVKWCEKEKQRAQLFRREPEEEWIKVAPHCI